MDILTFIGLDYRVASLIKFYFVVPWINIPKWTYVHSGNDYRVATLSIGQF